MPYESNPCLDAEGNPERSGLNNNNQANPELNEGATVEGDELDGATTSYGETPLAGSSGQGAYEGGFVVPTLQINQLVSSAFREKVIINQELFYNGERYNNLDYSVYRQEGQEYLFHPERDYANVRPARDDTDLKFFSMLPPSSAQSIQTENLGNKIDKFRFVSCKWWTYHPDNERFMKLDNTVSIGNDGTLSLPPARMAQHIQENPDPIGDTGVQIGMSHDHSRRSGMLSNIQNQASVICAHNIKFTKQSVFRNASEGYVDEFEVSLDENNPTVEKIIKDMVPRFHQDVPSLALEGPNGNLLPNKPSCMRFINDAYFYGPQSQLVFQESSPSVTNPEVSEFVRTRLGTLENSVFLFSSDDGVHAKVSPEYRDMVHSVEMPFYPSEAEQLNYTQYTTVDIRYVSLRSPDQEEFLNLPSDERAIEFSSRQRNVYRHYYSLLTKDENINPDILPSTVRTVPEELINLNDDEEWTKGRFEDWGLEPTFQQPAGEADPDSLGSGQLDGNEVNVNVEDCIPLDDDRLLFFTSDNVKEMMQINSQMKNLYDYYVTINIGTQQATAVSNILDDTEMDKYMLMSYLRPFIEHGQDPGPLGKWWHEELVTEILDQRVIDSRFDALSEAPREYLSGPNDRFIENSKQKLIEFNRHMDDINLDTMTVDLGQALKHFPLKFNGSEDLVTNAFFDLINMTVFKTRLDEFISPAKIINNDGVPISAGTDDNQSFDMSGDIRRTGKIRNFKDLLLGKKAYSETIGYKIEKYDYNQEGELNSQPLQTFVLCDSDEIKEIELLDNQIIYGKDYCYKVYAINFVLGTKYQYVPALKEQDAAGKIAVSQNKISLMVSTVPTMHLVETPYFIKKVSTIDKPPVFPSVSFIPLKGVDNRVGIDLSENTGVYRLEPVSIRDEDEHHIKLQREAAEASGDGKIIYKDDSPLTNFEIFRLDRAPNNYQDFANGSYREYYPRQGGTVDSVIRPGTMEEVPKTIIGRGTMFFDSISPNTDYYYTFRSVDHAGMSVPTSVFKVRLVSYENGIYLDVDTYEFPKEPQKSFFFQRTVEIAPALEQKIFNIPFDNSLEKAYQTVPETLVDLGIAEEKIWNKSFKFRISSCHTSRKIDLNVKFIQKSFNEKEPDKELTPCKEEEYSPAGHLDGRTVPCPPGSIRDFDTGECVEIPPPPTPPPKESVITDEVEETIETIETRPEPKPITPPVIEDTVLIIDPCRLFGSRYEDRISSDGPYGGLLVGNRFLTEENLGANDNLLLRQAAEEIDANIDELSQTDGAGLILLLSSQTLLEAGMQNFSPRGDSTPPDGLYEINVSELEDYFRNKYSAHKSVINNPNFVSDDSPFSGGYEKAQFYYWYTREVYTPLALSSASLTVDVHRNLHQSGGIIDKLCEDITVPEPVEPTILNKNLVDPCTQSSHGIYSIEAGNSEQQIATYLQLYNSALSDGMMGGLAVLEADADTLLSEFRAGRAAPIKPVNRARISVLNGRFMPAIREALTSAGVPHPIRTTYAAIEGSWCNNKVLDDLGRFVDEANTNINTVQVFFNNGVTLMNNGDQGGDTEDLISGIGDIIIPAYTRYKNSFLSAKFFLLLNEHYWELIDNLEALFLSQQWNGSQVISSDNRANRSTNAVEAFPHFFRIQQVRTRAPNKQYNNFEYDINHAILPGTVLDALVWQLIKPIVLYEFAQWARIYAFQDDQDYRVPAGSGISSVSANSPGFDKSQWETVGSPKPLQAQAQEYFDSLVSLHALPNSYRQLIQEFGDPVIGGGNTIGIPNQLAAFMDGRSQIRPTGHGPTNGGRLVSFTGAFYVAPNYVVAGDPEGFKPELLNSWAQGWLARIQNPAIPASDLIKLPDASQARFWSNISFGGTMGETRTVANAAGGSGNKNNSTRRYREPNKGTVQARRLNNGQIHRNQQGSPLSPFHYVNTRMFEGDGLNTLNIRTAYNFEAIRNNNMSQYFPLPQFITGRGQANWAHGSFFAYADMEARNKQGNAARLESGTAIDFANDVEESLHKARNGYLEIIAHTAAPQLAVD